jgi:hypothetical protein
MEATIDRWAAEFDKAGERFAKHFPQIEVRRVVSVKVSSLEIGLEGCEGRCSIIRTMTRSSWATASKTFASIHRRGLLIDRRPRRKIVGKIPSLTPGLDDMPERVEEIAQRVFALEGFQKTPKRLPKDTQTDMQFRSRRVSLFSVMTWG